MAPSELIKRYDDNIMGTMASQITCLKIVYSAVNQVQIKENIKALRHWPLTGGIHWWLMNILHKWPVTRNIFPFDNIIMINTGYDDGLSLVVHGARPLPKPMMHLRTVI